MNKAFTTAAVKLSNRAEYYEKLRKENEVHAFTYLYNIAIIITIINTRIIVGIEGTH